ncbi:MAG: phage tail protein, partial [Bacteroidia bacterium]
KSEGDKAMKEMTEKLNMLDSEVAEKETELANKLKDKQTNAIKAIDQKIEKMKESMSGALSKLGKLLLEAAKKFFTWALQKFGYSLAEIEGIINKGAAVLKAIFTKPIKFVKNLFNAASDGFANFGKNFLTHLKNALFSWLTGSLTEVKLPDTWDLKGIASVALQMVGISYQSIRKHLVKIIPEPVVEGMEKGFEIVKALITEGPMAAWEQLQEMAGEMKEAFVDAVKNWIKETIIVKAIEFVASLIIPGAGIIKAIIGIYDTVVFFIQKAKDIAQMVGNFLGSIGEIAMGNVGAAANALENGLATALSLVISFLAKLIHLDGVTAKIRTALNKIKTKVDGMMSKVAKWIAEKAKKLWGKLTGKDKNKKEESRTNDKSSRGIAWWGETRQFKDKEGEEHRLFYKGEGSNAILYVASKEDPVDKKEKEAEETAKLLESKEEISDDISKNNTQQKELKKEEGKLSSGNTGEVESKTIWNRFSLFMDKMKGTLAEILPWAIKTIPQSLIDKIDKKTSAQYESNKVYNRENFINGLKQDQFRASPYYNEAIKALVKAKGKNKEIFQSIAYTQYKGRWNFFKPIYEAIVHDKIRDVPRGFMTKEFFDNISEKALAVGNQYTDDTRIQGSSAMHLPDEIKVKDIDFAVMHNEQEYYSTMKIAFGKEYFKYYGTTKIAIPVKDISNNDFQSFLQAVKHSAPPPATGKVNSEMDSALRAWEKGKITSSKVLSASEKTKRNDIANELKKIHIEQMDFSFIKKNGEFDKKPYIHLNK